MNFIRSLFSEKGDVSSKRWISVTTSLAIVFGIVWVVIRYPDLISPVLRDAMIFVAIMSGVATVAQVAEIIGKTKEKIASGSKPPSPEPEKTEQQ